MTLKAVLCGCGAMAHGWMRALKTTPGLAEAITIVGLVDLDRSAARSLAEAFDLTDAVVGTDLDRVLEETRADLLFDVVVPVARKAVVAAGLKHGCHVLSEKPMATSLEEARELIALAETAGRIHAVVQNRRFISGIRRMRRFVESGAIGELTGVHCDFFIAPHFGGFREQMENVLLLDMAIHTFDAARFVSGKRPLSVYCLETNPAGSWYAHGASANAIFKFSDDVAFTYRGSWCAEGRRTSWESAWRLVGSKGMLTWDGEEAFEATVAGTGEGLLRGHRAIDVPPPPREEETHGHASVIADFLNAIRSGHPPETAGFDNIKSLAMVFGAIESARTGQPVAIQV
ncbi:MULTISPECIES: Gfo/Idh/MocA family oxidoreductase [Rhizobium/Agrobacterium group]|uniref:Gfo/Idh/MocA family oxidoreductase n=2 Tax=Neorhizobium TaxID=1525371 RepID=A0ABV0M868_9HYPH|nr:MULTISPECIES: Gfo/Idh/MocA family oxidoreductase [Rhizobium/Agrobacterium group]KGD96476.1 oxidoreductase [Rhizobium sp. YS-1r]MCC2611909.1 Gfo/Idh/MocA family oxidoreductase [Neorhizobium petrolearium]WGI67072.1 Gfo/Idh/MocA family oxidoreductase [Neorhizobium petrolearium]